MASRRRLRRSARPFRLLVSLATLAVLAVVSFREVSCASSTSSDNLRSTRNTKNSESEVHELSPGRDGGLLRRILFGGEPFVTICREKIEDAENRAQAFAESLRRELEAKKSQVQVVRAPCGEKFGASGNSLQKFAKLRREGNGIPVLMWTAHGRPAKQLPAKYYTSSATGSTKKQSQNSNQPNQKNLVQLDAGKLAKGLDRSEKVKLYPLKSNSALAKECLDLKYQTCAIMLKEGGSERLASNKVALLSAIAKKHRFMRVFTLDTKEFALTFGGDFSASQLADESLLLVRRSEFIYSGSPEFAPPRDAEAEAAKEAEAEALRSPHKVADTDRFSSGIALSLGMKEIGQAETASDRMLAFRKGAVQSQALARRMNLEEKQQSKLVFLFHSESSQDGYLLDWAAARGLLMERAVFGASDVAPHPPAADLAELQYATLMRAKRGDSRSSSKSKSTSKKSKGSYLVVHPPRLLKDSDRLLQEVRQFVQDSNSGTFLPYQHRPSLSKIVSKKSRTYSPTPYTSSTKYNKRQKKSKSSVSDRDWERRRRQQMEEEAKAFGATAVVEEEDAEFDDDSDRNDQDSSISYNGDEEGDGNDDDDGDADTQDDEDEDQDEEEDEDFDDEDDNDEEIFLDRDEL
eukprot:CAMPEP_0171539438 /NCGR_PEP_ID=MMETSP0960-20121227/608_1 /TAXON_ID=87120 /ORGANISM="Aurantiochytrium limacinum, Strain ATCCMYA-1381" /LENGTH=632 /DNA_ID=CAMNT_0012086461 /DNA_START=8 /DNA_END=1906 /DNA_ORIENTATION=-